MATASASESAFCSARPVPSVPVSHGRLGVGVCCCPWITADELIVESGLLGVGVRCCHWTAADESIIGASSGVRVQCACGTASATETLPFAKCWFCLDELSWKVLPSPAGQQHRRWQCQRPVSSCAGGGGASGGWIAASDAFIGASSGVHVHSVRHRECHGDAPLRGVQVL